MNDAFLHMLKESLDGREKRGLIRSLKYDDAPVSSSSPIDFSSNDYLGLARSQELEERTRDMYASMQAKVLHPGGSTGSRLLSGDSLFAHELEKKLAEFHNGESALLFNSGYDANMSVLSSLPQENTIIFFDELVHNSMREGMRLSRSKLMVPFKHNDLQDLRAQLAHHVPPTMTTHQQLMLVVESVYSMDGDVAPLEEMVRICKEHPDMVMIVDEAHGTGVLGKQGRGACNINSHVESSVLCRVYTFGKALGSHGAVVVGPSVVRKYLINYARPLIYSTSLPLYALVRIHCAYEYLIQHAEDEQVKLPQVISRFREAARRSSKIQLLPSETAIQAVRVPGNHNVMRFSQHLRAKGFEVYPIRAPTVKQGEERIRVVLHSFNSLEEVDALLLTLAELFEKN